MPIITVKKVITKKEIDIEKSDYKNCIIYNKYKNKKYVVYIIYVQ